MQITRSPRIAVMVFAALASASALSACVQRSTESQTAESLPQCEWCGASDAPGDLSWRTSIAAPDEPGDRLVISGVVFLGDGVTPAAGTLIYVYHTDIAGLYTRRGDETGNGLRHGGLRGWMRTDAEGRYEFDTIRPVAYPNQQRDAAHIHVTVTPAGEAEGYLAEYVFSDDPLVSDRDRAASQLLGRFGPVLSPTLGADEILRAQRDLRVSDRKTAG